MTKSGLSHVSKLRKLCVPNFVTQSNQLVTVTLIESRLTAHFKIKKTTCLGGESYKHVLVIVFEFRGESDLLKFRRI